MTESTRYKILRGGVVPGASGKRHAHIFIMDTEEDPATLQMGEPQLDPQTQQPIPGSEQPVPGTGMYRVWSTNVNDHAHAGHYDPKTNSFIFENDDHEHPLDPSLEIENKDYSLGPDEKEEGELVEEVVGLWRNAPEVLNGSAERWREAMAFKMGDQWPQSIKMRLLAENRTVLTKNIVGVKLNEISGYQRQNRTTIGFTPIEGGVQQAADLLNFAWNIITERCNYDRTKSKAFEHLCLGKGGMKIEMNASRSLVPEIKIVPIDPRRIRTGPFEYDDMSDCEYIVEDYWLSKEAVKRAYPDAADDIENRWLEYETTINGKAGGGTGSDYSKSGEAEDERPDHLRHIISEDALFDLTQKNIRILEATRKISYPKAFLVVVDTEDVIDVSGFRRQDLRELENIDGVQLVRIMKWIFRKTIIGGGKVLDDEFPAQIPGDSFNISLGYAMRDDDNYWGLVDLVKDLQREVNFRISQSIDIGNRMFAEAYFYSDEIFDKTEADHFKKKITTPGAVFKVRSISTMPQRWTGTPFPVGAVEMQQNAEASLDELLSVVAREPGANTSSAAIQAAQKLKLVGKEFLFDALYDLERKVAKQFIFYLKEYISPQRLFKMIASRKNVSNITDQEKAVFTFTIEQIADILDKLDPEAYSITISESSYSPSIRMTIRSTLLEMMNAGVQVPPNIVTKYMDIPENDKQFMLTQFNTQQESQAAAAGDTRDMELSKGLIGQGVIPPKIFEEYQLDQAMYLNKKSQVPNKKQDSQNVQGSSLAGI